MTLAHKRPKIQASRQAVRRPARRPHVPAADLSQALTRQHCILQRLRQQGDLFGVASCYLELGDLYLASGQSERANELYRMSLDVSRQLTCEDDGLPASS